jgi:death-on-curing protein
VAKRRIIKPLSIIEVEHLAFRLAQEHLTFDEPIPDFSTRFPNILEGCLETPFQRFFGKIPYPSLIAKAGMLFYLLIKNHPFQNGNKRIAITTLIIFLYKNNQWLEAGKRQIYNFAVWVAKSKSGDKDFVSMAIFEFIRRHLKPLEPVPLLETK